MNPQNNIVTFIQNHKKPLALLLIAGALIILNLLSIFIYNLFQPSVTAEEESHYSYNTCNVQGILLRGDIYTYSSSMPEEGEESEYSEIATSEDLMYYISDAEYRDNVQAILIEVDSYGGSPAAAEEISEAVKSAQKPVVVYVRQSAVSAAYYAIAYADRIFALKNSDIGGIGVTQSYVDNVGINEREGYSFVELAAGKFKDSGSPDKPITQEERELFMRDLTIIHDNFIAAVAEGRNLSIEKVQGLADGSMMLGQQAKEVGLIDDIGGYNEALTYIEDNYIEDIADVCW